MNVLNTVHLEIVKMINFIVSVLLQLKEMITFWKMGYGPKLLVFVGIFWGKCFLSPAYTLAAHFSSLWMYRTWGYHPMYELVYSCSLKREQLDNWIVCLKEYRNGVGVELTLTSLVP